jgi:hypothetical protein
LADTFLSFRKTPVTFYTDIAKNGAISDVSANFSRIAALTDRAVINIRKRLFAVFWFCDTMKLHLTLLYFWV